MTIPEAAQLVIQAGSMGMGGDVFLLDMGQPVRILDLAIKMIQLAGYRPGYPDPNSGDIEVQVVGLRPGEKLYEELLISGWSLPTGHPRISRAQEDFLRWSELREVLTELFAAVEVGGLSQIVGYVGAACRWLSATRLVC